MEHLTKSASPNLYDQPPKVIGFVPAYNSESHIIKTLEALANQDYQNFEIWICDDASTDGTPRICKDFCKNDFRFKFFSNEINQGWWKTSIQFWKSCSEISEFCFFNPHDDIPEPTFISNQVYLLKKNPQAVLCVPGMKNTYSNGKCNYAIHDKLGSSLKASERIIPLVNWEVENWWAAYHGIHRSKFVLRILPVTPLRFGEREFALDLIWLIKLASLGPFICANQVLFEKHYSQKSLSGQWKYNFINRSAVYIGIVEVIINSSNSFTEKVSILNAIFKKAIGSIINRFRSPK